MSIAKHTTYNLVGSLVPLVASLITVPLYLSVIGESRYGVLAIAWLLLGYFGLFDLGLGRATAQRVAIERHSSKERISRVFWTAVILNLGLGVLGGAIIWPVAHYFFANVFQIEPVLRAEILASIQWLVLAVPVATLSAVLAGALQGRERFLELNIISTVGLLLFQFLPLLAAYQIGASLSVIIPVAILSRLIATFGLYFCCKRHFDGYHRSGYSAQESRNLVGFGGWVTLTSVVAPMMEILDRLAIGALLDVKNVTLYTIPFQLAQRTTVVASALSSALLPRLASSSHESRIRLASNSISVLMLAYTPPILVGLFIFDLFLCIWISQEFAEEAGMTGKILLVGFWLNSFARVPFVSLQAEGRPDIVAKCHVAEIVPYLLLLFWSLENWGLIGAAIVFGFRALVDLLLLSYFSGVLRVVVSRMGLPAVVLLSAVLVTSGNSAGTLAWSVALAVSATLVVVWSLLYLPNSIKKSFREALNFLN